MNNLIKLTVIGLTYSQDDQNAIAYALVLGEENGSRRIPIVVGAFEAQSIAMYLQNLTPSRPLTHDLFLGVMHAYQIALDAVIISRIEKGVFFSEMLFNNAADVKVKIDARTSDAIALAVRLGAPVYTTKEVMQQAAILFETPIFDEDDEFTQSDLFNSTQKKDKAVPTADRPFAALDDDELQTELNIAIRDENYEKARILSEEMKKREK